MEPKDFPERSAEDKRAVENTSGGRRMILIIAYGNTLRRDDGAGLFLGEILERTLRDGGREVRRIVLHQLTPEVAVPIADEGISSVVFVDTRVALQGEDSPDLTVSRVPQTGGPPGVGHHLDPSTVMAYAKALYGKYPPAWLLTVPGVDFDHGEGFSSITRNALSRLPQLLSSLPPTWPETGPLPSSDA